VRRPSIRKSRTDLAGATFATVFAAFDLQSRGFILQQRSYTPSKLPFPSGVYICAFKDHLSERPYSHMMSIVSGELFAG